MRSALTSRIFKRLLKYTSIGIPTYVIDISIVYLLTQVFNAPYTIALIIGFVIGVSINYYFEYHWVFRGTKRKALSGYLIFLSIGACGIVFILYGTTFMMETFALPLLVARSVTGLMLGIFGFFFNAIYNFKLL